VAASQLVRGAAALWAQAGLSAKVAIPCGNAVHPRWLFMHQSWHALPDLALDTSCSCWGMDYSPAETATPSTGGYTNSAARAASWAGTDPQHLQFTSPTPSSQAGTAADALGAGATHATVLAATYHAVPCRYAGGVHAAVAQAGGQAPGGQVRGPCTLFQHLAAYHGTL
jgi:hypothetical protein